MKAKYTFILLLLLAISLGSCKKSPGPAKIVPAATGSVSLLGITYTNDSLNATMLNQQVAGSYQTYIPVSDSSASGDFAIYGQIVAGSNTLDSTGLAGYGTTAGQLGLVFTLGATASAMSANYYGNSGTIQLSGTTITINAIVENINTGVKYPLTGTFNF